MWGFPQGHRRVAVSDSFTSKPKPFWAHCFHTCHLERASVSTRTSYLHSLRDMRARPSPRPPPTGSGARPGRQQRPLKGWQRCRPRRTPQRPRRTAWTGSKSSRAGPAPTGQGTTPLTARWGHCALTSLRELPLFVLLLSR